MSTPQVAMVHPSIPGVVAYATEAAFADVWQPKGWVLGGANADDALVQSPVLNGPLANRPTPSQVPTDAIYFADEGGIYRSDGGNWIAYAGGTTTGGGSPGDPITFVNGGHVTGLTATSTDLVRAHVTELH